MEIAKSLFHDYWKNLVIIILAFLLFKSCKSGEQLQVANKEKVKELIGKSEQLLAKNNQLSAKIGRLEIQKQNSSCSK
jgi:hypothetical protein